MCKQLWLARMMDSFWISGHKVKAMVAAGGDVSIITHEEDFADLYPGIDLRPYFAKVREV